MKADNKVEITKLQKSYIIGKSMNQALGGVSCHAYYEFTGKKVDSEKLEKAWNMLMKRHVMTQAKINSDGKVDISGSKMPKRFFCFDLRNWSGEKIKQRLDDCRENISHRRMMIERGQGLGLILFLLPDNNSRICFDIDLTLCDVNGIQELLNELALLYQSTEETEREYIWNAQRLLNKKQDTDIDKIIATVPYGANAKKLHSCHYRSLDYILDNRQVNVLRKYFEEKESDLFGGMLATLLESRNEKDFSKEFIVNIPYFMPTKEGDDFVRDNTRILWLTGQNEPDLAKKITNKVDTGINSDNELQYMPDEGIVPVVYSFNQNGVFLNEAFRQCFGDLDYMISQTPNVCLDVQLFYMTDGLWISFVYPEEMDGTDKIEELFISYKEMIQKRVNKYGQE